MQIFVTKDGQQSGPYTTEQVQSYLAEGRLLYTDLLWYEGLPDWQPINTVFAPPRTAPFVQRPAPQRPNPMLSSGHRMPASRPGYQKPAPASRSSSGPGFLKIGLFAMTPILLWLGLTFAVAVITKSTFEKQLAKSQMASLESYRMGLFSSSALTHVHFGDDEDKKGALPLRHKISHGPVAFIDNKPRLTASHVTTRFEPRGEGKTEIPLSIVTEAGFGGNLNHAIICRSIDMDLADGETLKFDGGKLQLTSNSDKTAYEGSLNISPLKVSGEMGSFVLNETKGQLLYETAGRFELGATLGGIELETTKQGASTLFAIDSAIVSSKFNHHSRDIPLYVGTASLRLPKIEINGGFPSLLKNIEFSSKSVVDSSQKLNASLQYQIDSINLGTADAPMFELDKTSLEYGVKGLDASLIAKLNEENRSLYGAQFKTIFEGDMSDIQSRGNIDESTNRIVKIWLDLIQPGAEIYTKVKVDGDDGMINLNAKFGGDKNLTDTQSLREVISALEAALKVHIRGELIESPMLAMLIQTYSEMGIGNFSPELFQLEGAVKNGTVYIGDEATPFIEALGPMLDEPIDWQEMIKEGLAEN
ncbi:MAG: DUF945 family protein [Verrucomicrobiales bacterium]|nr:DUF945 family protein [Verrucomicrobiales bacterium]